MKRNDVILIFVLLFFILLLVCSPRKKGEEAIVTYQGKTVLTIDLTNKESKYYQVKGTNGIVTLYVNQGKIKVTEEKSPRHLCSKQGYIEKAGESIVCLPNELVIEITGKQTLDTVVR